jgi:hypothetical protein
MTKEAGWLNVPLEHEFGPSKPPFSNQEHEFVVSEDLGRSLWILVHVSSGLCMS